MTRSAFAAGGDGALLRVRPEDLRGIRRRDDDEALQRHPPLRDALGVDDRHARLHPDVAAGGVGDVPAAQLDPPRRAQLVGGHGGERAVEEPRPEPLPVLLVLERGVVWKTTPSGRRYASAVKVA